ncbi:hypothetical protein D3C75_1100130 [compost metagenome]
MLYSCHASNLCQLVLCLSQKNYTFHSAEDRQQLHIIGTAVEASCDQHYRLFKGAQSHRSRLRIGCFGVVEVSCACLIRHILQPVLDSAEGG